MTPKEEHFFKQELWYHGTTLYEWKSLCENGIIATYNIGTSLDFGCGFYLSPKESDTVQYALNVAKYCHDNCLICKTPIVLAFSFVPYEHIINGATYKYFAKYDDEFAEYVFNCRINCYDIPNDGTEIVAGVMTDGVPTAIMEEFKNGTKTKELVLEEFKKSTSKKQLCLRNQEICDKLQLVRAYVVGGKELDADEYRKIKKTR